MRMGGIAGLLGACACAVGAAPDGSGRFADGGRRPDARDIEGIGMGGRFWYEAI